MVCLDTHVVVWLYAGELSRIPKRVKDRLEAEELGISPMVMLELQYLHEIGRITDGAALIFQTLAPSIGLALCSEPFQQVITESLMLHWTREPFDRVIVAQSKMGGHDLITQDRMIHRHFSSAFW